MKTKISLCLLTAACLLTALSSCNSNSYANALKEEKQLIADYIERENINIIYEEPANGNWGEKDYLEIGDNCYFHLTKAGDTEGDSLTTKHKVLLRYKQYTLEPYQQTIKNCWSTNESANPVEFQYGISSSATCTGWLLALQHMRHNGAEGKLICPSKLGFTESGNQVIPYGYDMKIQIRNF